MHRPHIGDCCIVLLASLTGLWQPLLAADPAAGSLESESPQKALSGYLWVDADISFQSTISARNYGKRSDDLSDVKSPAPAETSLNMDITVDGITLPLELEVSHLAAHIEQRALETGEASVYMQTPKLFTGKVSNDPDSWVRLAKQGENAFSGQIKAYGQYYEFNTDNELRSTRLRKLPSLKSQLHSLKSFPQPPTGYDYELFAPGSENPLDFTTRASDKTLQQLRFEDDIAVPGALRIAAVIDSHFDEHHNGRGVTRALSLINVVDGIYQEQFGVALVLDSVVAYTDPATDPLRGVDRPVAGILDDFRAVRMQEPQLRPDLTLMHLFTGLRDPEGVLGLGWINTACRSDGYNISVSTPFTYDALLAAHEMAHNLGAVHDDSTSCSANRSNIMWPRLSGQTEPSFSQCTLNDVRTGLAAACNLENIDLSVALESQRGPDGSGRLLVATVINNDPARSAEQVRMLVRLPPGSRVIEMPSVCTVTTFEQSGGPEVVCEMGDVPNLVGRRLEMTLGLSTAPDAQWTRVDVASLVAADSQPINNFAQLDLRLLGIATEVGDDESVTVASASSEIIGDSIVTTAPQPVPGTQATQLFLPDGSSLILDDSNANLSGVSSGGASGIGRTGWQMLAVLMIMILLKRTLAGAGFSVAPLKKKSTKC